jgi:hypothetical protein
LVVDDVPDDFVGSHGGFVGVRWWARRLCVLV